MELLVLDDELNLIDVIASFSGKKGFLLMSEKDLNLCSIDNKLILIDENETHMVLQCNDVDKFFWHMTKSEDYFFVHEYGNSPCSIYKSNDLERWDKVISNHEIDKKSRHFHNIYGDQQRRWLIANLGDNCLTRVIYSTDMGESWETLYKGPWQFVPITAFDTKLVFGMDSGIVKGGYGIYSFDDRRWRFTFLRWTKQDIKLSQFCDLRYTAEGYWLAALGTPQAFVISKDLVSWHPLHIESYSNEYNHAMSINVSAKHVLCSTGKSLVTIPRETLFSYLDNETVMERYGSVLDTVRGFAFNVKHNVIG